MMIDRISLLLVIIGALNWGSVALFQLDLVAYLFGGSDAMISRVVYALVALGGIWCISLFVPGTVCPSDPGSLIRSRAKKPLASEWLKAFFMLPFSDIPGPELIDIGTDEPGQGLVVIKEHEVPRSQQEVKPIRSVFHHFIGYILHAQELDHQEVYQHHHAVEQDILQHPVPAGQQTGSARSAP